MASYLLKAPDDQMGRWKAEAREAGVSFAEWIRDRLDAPAPRAAARASGGRVAAAEGAAPPTRAERARRGPRAAMCEHRIPPTAHCKVCDP